MLTDCVHDKWVFLTHSIFHLITPISCSRTYWYYSDYELSFSNNTFQIHLFTYKSHYLTFCTAGLNLISYIYHIYYYLFICQCTSTFQIKVLAYNIYIMCNICMYVFVYTHINCVCTTQWNKEWGGESKFEDYT